MTELTPEEINRTILETLDISKLQSRIRDLEAEVERLRKQMDVVVRECPDCERIWESRHDEGDERQVCPFCDRDTANRLLRSVMDEAIDECYAEHDPDGVIAAAKKHLEEGNT